MEISEEDVELITREAAALVPAIAKARPVRAYASVRPLIKMEGGVDGREATRDFAIVRHARPRNLITIIGGKFTTGRLVGGSGRGGMRLPPYWLRQAVPHSRAPAPGGGSIRESEGLGALPQVRRDVAQGEHG